MALAKNQDKRESEINFRSVNYEIAILRNFFNHCIEKGYIDKNPCAGVKKLNELSRLKTLSNDDIEKLIKSATNKLIKDLISFLIYIGCRKGEALNLKWDDVDLKNDVVTIKGTKMPIAVVSDTHIGFCRTPVAESFGHSYRSLSDT